METPACPCEQRRAATAEQQEANKVRPDVPSAPQSAPPVHPHQHRPFLSVLHRGEGSAAPPLPASAAQVAPNLPNGAASHLPQIPLERIDSEAASVSSLYRSNALFARLIAGEESEQGEAPPQYDQVVAIERAGPGGLVTATADVVPAHG